MTLRAEVLLDSCYFLLGYDDLDKTKLAIICCLLFRVRKGKLINFVVMQTAASPLF